MIFNRDSIIKKIRKWMKIAGAVGMAAVLVEGSSLDSDCESDRSFNELLTDSDYSHTEFPFCRIESKKLEANEYKVPRGNFIFYKNLSSSTKESPNTADILIETKNHLDIYHYSQIYTCFYAERNIDENIKKVPCLHISEFEWPKKSIFVPNITKWNKEVHEKRVEEAKRLKEEKEAKRQKKSTENTEEPDIKKAMEILVQIIDIKMSKLYIYEMGKAVSDLYTIKTVNESFIKRYYFFDWNDSLKKLVGTKDAFRDTFTYWLFSIFEAQYDCWVSLIEKYIPMIDEIIARNCFSEIDNSNYIDLVESSTVEKVKLITAQTEEIEKECAKYTEEEQSKSFEDRMDLLEHAKKQTAMHIDMLMLKDYLFDEDSYTELNENSARSRKRIKVGAKNPNENLLSQLENNMHRYKTIKENPSRSDIVSTIREGNAKVFLEVNRKNEELARAKSLVYLHRIGSLLKNIKQVIKKETLYMGITESTVEHIKTILAVINSLIDITQTNISPEEKKKIAEVLQDKVIKEILKIVSHCIEIETEEGPLIRAKKPEKELFREVMYVKEEIVSLLLSSLSFGEIDITKYSDLVLITRMLRKVLEKIVDIVLCKYTERINYNKYKDLEKMAEQEEKRLDAAKDDVRDAIKCLVEFSKKFWYTPEKFYLKYTNILSSIADGVNTSAYIMKNCDLSGIHRLLNYTYHAYKYINSLNMCTEVWDNFAVLYLKVSFNPNLNPMYSMFCSIIYLKEDKIPRTKQIEFTNETLEAFRKAKTLADIKRIPGTKKSIKEFKERDILEVYREIELELAQIEQEEETEQSAPGG